MGTMKLLLVDDEQRFIETTQNLLKRKGFEVITAGNGIQALETLERNNIDVMVLDVKMPGMDGVATLKEVKRHFPTVEVIMLTGHGTIDSAVDGLKSGAFDYLTKPCDIDELLEKTQKAFQRKMAQEEKIRAAQVRKFVRSPRAILKAEQE